jgi:hypothetical protein
MTKKEIKHALDLLSRPTLTVADECNIARIYLNGLIDGDPLSEDGEALVKRCYTRDNIFRSEYVQWCVDDAANTLLGTTSKYRFHLTPDAETVSYKFVTKSGQEVPATVRPANLPNPHDPIHPDRPFLSFIYQGRKYHVYFHHRRHDVEYTTYTNDDYKTVVEKRLVAAKELPASYRRATKRGTTTCTIIPDDTKDQRYWAAESACSWSDTFLRSEGRRVSLIKALVAFGFEDRYNIMDSNDSWWCITWLTDEVDVGPGPGQVKVVDLDELLGPQPNDAA